MAAKVSKRRNYATVTLCILLVFSALTLLVGRQEGHPACKKTEWWGAGVVVCLEQGADLHTAQLMPLPRTVSCFRCVCVCVCVCVTLCILRFAIGGGVMVMVVGWVDSVLEQ